MPSNTLTAALIGETLRNVIDPELGVNIVDLGLIHDLRIDDDKVTVVMTLTTPGCPLAGFIEDEIDSWLAELPQIRRAVVQLVWDPPWSPAAMTEQARDVLGWKL